MKSLRPIATLFLLYLSQGLPFGFQATALPVYLRRYGVSLTAIGFAGALALPWLLKPLWAPLVDRYWSKKTGRRKSWIIPLQLLLIMSMAAASFFSPGKNLPLLLMLVFLMNLFAATQDIAVDGLAVDILENKDLGLGNAAQVVGYKTGMILSGGLLVYLSGIFGWEGMFYSMALLAFLPLIPVLLYSEPPPVFHKDSTGPTMKEIIKTILLAFREKGALWIIVFIGTYKLGEIMIDIMFKPFLVDSGFTAPQIGLWVGTYGMAASLVGSLAGGLLARKVNFVRAVFIAASLRIIPLVMELWITTFQPADMHVIATTLAEHFFGGILTTAMFAFMMSRVNREIGATHYTALAALEVLGKSPGAWASGFLAENIGYTGLFSIGVVLSIAVLALYPKVKAVSVHVEGRSD